MVARWVGSVSRAKMAQLGCWVLLLLCEGLPLHATYWGGRYNRYQPAYTQQQETQDESSINRPPKQILPQDGDPYLWFRYQPAEKPKQEASRQMTKFADELQRTRDTQVPNSRVEVGEWRRSSSHGMRAFSLVPCSIPALEHVAHPADPTKYYQCVYGYYKLKTCGNQKWDPISHTCVQPQSDAGKDADWRSGSPCVGVNLQYQPYPADERKYIVCQSDGRWEVRWCNAGYVWVQPLQTCVELAPVPPTTPTAPTTDSPTQPSQGWCQLDGTFYLPYPPDASKFVQCDEFGNAYLRDCGPEKQWYDDVKTCVGSNQVGLISNSTENAIHQAEPALTTYDDGSPDIRCPAGYIFDSFLSRCMALEYREANDPDDPTQSDYIPGPQCHDGYLWDSDIMMCVKAVHLDQLPPELIHADSLSNEARAALILLLSRGKEPMDFNSQENHNMDQYNPCETEKGFYFPHPSNTQQFIQCDQSRVPYIMTCPEGLVWSQELLNCDRSADTDNTEDNNHHTRETIQEAPQREVENRLPTPMEELGPICQQSSQMYHAYPDDPSVYVLCAHTVAYLMPCPHGLLWNDSRSTCTQP